MSYRLTEIALADLRQIYSYSADRWNVDRARTYIQSLYGKLESLAVKPDRDLSRNRRSHPFQMIPAGAHFIVYETVEDIVVIHTILHQSQDIERYIAKLTPEFRKAIAEINRRR